MTRDTTFCPPNLIRSARDVRDLSHEQLAEAAGLDVALVRKAEDEDKADAPTLRALASALELPVERLEAAGKTRREHVLQWVAIGLAVLFLFSAATGYRAGKDMALRDNYRDCVASGASDCVRG
ncbi:helix-turn-helix domain-containing protein [Luteimonas sp. e5]